MAEQDVIKKLNAKLECSICLDSFKRPKLLPCYHVFCESPCLEKLVAQNGLSLTCPICRHVVPLSKRGVAGLQSDFHIDNLFEIRDALNKSTESAKTHCGNCEKEMATGYCQECQDFLCDECQGAHHTLKMTRSHQMISLREFQQQAVKIITAKKMTPICKKHSNNEVKIYCDTCKELICYDCTIRLHKDHSCDPVTDIFLKHKEELVSSLKPLKQKVTRIQQSLTVFDNLAIDIHSQRVSLKADINKEIDEQQQLLDQQRKKLVDAVEMLTEQKLEALATQRESIEMIRVKLISCLEYAEGTIKTGTQCQVLEMKAPALERIKHISTEFDLNSLRPKINSFTTLIMNGKEELRETQKSYLKLHTTHDILSNSVNEKGLKQATVNQKAKLELNAEIYPSLIDATVTDCQSRKTIRCQVIESEKKYQIIYTPTNRGKHEINLTINGTHIRGSPFTMVVMPQPHTLGVPIKVISHLKRPWGVAVNSKGHLIVTERGSGRIIIYNESQSYKQIQKFNTHGNAPVGVTIDGDDNIYVSDREKHIVQKFAANGQFLLAVGTKGDHKLHFDEPCELGYNKYNEKIYISDHRNNRVQILNTDLTFHSIINISQPDGVAFDSIGNTYIASYSEHNVMVFDSNGKLLRTFGMQGSGSGQLTAPLGITISNTDIVYVAEMDGHRISIFKTNGEFIHSFGKIGLGKGQFKGPAGIAINNNGYIVVTDRENGRIQVF